MAYRFPLTGVKGLSQATSAGNGAGFGSNKMGGELAFAPLVFVTSIESCDQLKRKSSADSCDAAVKPVKVIDMSDTPLPSKSSWT